MNYSCLLCDCSLIESRYRYTVSGRSSFNILDAIKSLPFNVIVTGQSYVCRTCFARLKKKKGLEEAYDKCVKELRECFENIRASHSQPDGQPITSTPTKITAPALRDPVIHAPVYASQVEVEKHTKTSSKASVSVG